MVWPLFSTSVCLAPIPKDPGEHPTSIKQNQIYTLIGKSEQYQGIKKYHTKQNPNKTSVWHPESLFSQNHYFIPPRNIDEGWPQTTN